MTVSPVRVLSPHKRHPPHHIPKHRTHTNVKIHCSDGINAVIPEHLKDLRIDAAWLEANEACNNGRDACLAKFPSGATYPQVREWIAGIGRQDWENWLLAKVGGDVAIVGNYGTATAGDRGTATAGDGGTATAGYKGTATAGYKGTATAGDRGTATAGYKGTATAGDRGTATAGDHGTATAGDRGTATAGDRGTATAGDHGTATAGDYGTATAGEFGTLIIKRFDESSSRYRLSVGCIGENGLKAYVKYKLDDNGNFIEA